MMIDGIDKDIKEKEQKTETSDNSFSEILDDSLEIITDIIGAILNDRARI